MITPNGSGTGGAVQLAASGALCAGDPTLPGEAHELMKRLDVLADVVPGAIAQYVELAVENSALLVAFEAALDLRKGRDGRPRTSEEIGRLMVPPQPTPQQLAAASRDVSRAADWRRIADNHVTHAELRRRRGLI